jgi:hypothetical protein
MMHADGSGLATERVLSPTELSPFAFEETPCA